MITGQPHYISNVRLKDDTLLILQKLLPVGKVYWADGWLDLCNEYTLTF